MTKVDKLSERQTNIVQYIWQYISENSRPPTIREIGEAVNISSTSVVNYNLQKLTEKGLISRDSEVSRGLRLTDKAREMFGLVVDSVVESLIRVPMVGDIVASEPLEIGQTDGQYDEDVEISPNMLPERTKADQLFALRVNGDSMIDAMVNHGDIVIMRKQHEAKNGDMVAVWIDNDTMTLKHFFNEKSQVRLQPANPTMEPIYVDPQRVQVQGKVVMVVRQTS